MFCFFLKLRGTPSSTLFPYTTLFRSHQLEEAVAGLDHQLGVVGEELQRRLAVGQQQGDPEFVEDRKSTRLNSSHVESSYAVFCLKKKNGHTFAHYPLSIQLVANKETV